MKKIMLLAVLLFAAFSASAQSIKNVGTHDFSIGPLAGYNLKTEGFTYGADLSYEYWPFEKWGFTAGLSYERTRSDLSGTWSGYDGEKMATGLGHWDQNLYTASLGARRYFGNLFVGAAFGLGYETGVTTFEEGAEVKSKDRYGFYQNYSVGYQVPLANKNKLEFFGGVFGAGAMKVGGGVRYKFGFK